MPVSIPKSQFQPRYKLFDTSQLQSNNVSQSLNWLSNQSSHNEINSNQTGKYNQAHITSADNWLHAIQRNDYTPYGAQPNRADQCTPLSLVNVNKIIHHRNNVPFHTQYDPTYANTPALTENQRKLIKCRESLRASANPEPTFSVPESQLHNTINYMSADYNIDAVPLYSRQVEVCGKVSAVALSLPLLKHSRQHFKNNRYTTSIIEFRNSNKSSIQSNTTNTNSNPHNNIYQHKSITRPITTQSLAMSATTNNVSTAFVDSTYDKTLKRDPVIYSSFTNNARIDANRNVVSKLQKIAVPRLGKSLSDHTLQQMLS